MSYKYLIIVIVLMSIPLFSNAEEKMQTTKSQETTILFLGDSLTEGFGVEPEESFPTLLEDMLEEKGYKNIKIINAGISGSTTASAKDQGLNGILK